MFSLMFRLFLDESDDQNPEEIKEDEADDNEGLERTIYN